MANQTSILAYNELRNEGATGAQSCQKVLQSGGAEKGKGKTTSSFKRDYPKWAQYLESVWDK